MRWKVISVASLALAAVSLILATASLVSNFALQRRLQALQSAPVAVAQSSPVATESADVSTLRAEMTKEFHKLDLRLAKLLDANQIEANMVKTKNLWVSEKIMVVGDNQRIPTFWVAAGCSQAGPDQQCAPVS